MDHWEQLLTASSTTEQSIIHNNNYLDLTARPDLHQSQTFPRSDSLRIDNLLQPQSYQHHQQQHQPHQQQHQSTYDGLLDLSSLSSYSYVDYVSHHHQEEAIATSRSDGLMDYPNATVGAPYHLQYVPSQSSSDLQEIQHMMSLGYDFSDFGSYPPSSGGYYAFELPNYAPTFTTFTATTNDAADVTTVPIAHVPAADVPVSEIMIDHGENSQPRPHHHESTKLSCSEPNCTSQFVTQSELDTHLVTKHYHNKKVEKTQFFVCTHEKCTKSFKARSDLKRHARIHRNVRPYQCTWKGCDYRGGKDRQTALNHIRVIHLNIRGVGVRVSRMNGGPDPRDYLKVIKEWL